MPRPAGLPKTGGRQKGSPNKVTADVKEAAQQYTAEAVETLASIMRLSESDQAKVAAVKEILDRGWGKAKQTSELTGPNGQNLIPAVDVTFRKG